MPVPQRVSFLVGWAGEPAPKRLSRMVQDVSFYSHLAPFSRTGKMPVPQRVNFLVGWAKTTPLKDLSRMVQDVSYYSHLAPFSRTGKMPVSQEMNFLVEQALLPVHKRLIENGARCQLLRTFLVDVF